ncbi:hypothetical protein SAMD00023353_2300620 [Rosellinia necatrix]|uniref:Uncharacterized protein n=1 Tax=Rosellinia necatrix TaxID=77044 RepID=A0A1S8A7Y0_ROSNE|nr:hypothetical protein SAMD00023353_2300620 [Rosellinia necatrix]
MTQYDEIVGDRSNQPPVPVQQFARRPVTYTSSMTDYWLYERWAGGRSAAKKMSAGTKLEVEVRKGDT